MVLGAVLAAMLASERAKAAPIHLGRVGDAEVTFDRDLGLGGLEAVVNGVRIRPLAGAGALGPDGKVAAGIPLDIEAAIADEALRLTITSPSREPHGIDPGLVEGLGAWRRLDLSRYAEPYGQAWWPKATYSVEGDFWFTAHWVMEDSDGTNWVARDQRNSGTGPFPAALAVAYAADTAGERLPIHEVLELRFSRLLWDTVPVPRQRPSEYRDFLTQAVFVDLWGGEPAAEMRRYLEVLQAVARGRVPLYTILQNWSAGGWDALLPDSMWLPDHAPNPGVGTVDELRELCAFGKTLGRFGFRTNYRVLLPEAPSFQRGLAHYALNADGRPSDYVRPADWLPVARRAEEEIAQAFAPNAAFTDQMTSGAAPWSWHDYAADGGSRSTRRTLQHQQALARMIKATQAGPLSSETLSDQHLLGEFVDTGDYGIMDGRHRLFSPEYKLRHLQHLSGFHGMGLMYRFYEMPPFPQFHSGATPFRDSWEDLDDYRACEVLYANGGYVCQGFAGWRYTLTEVLLIGSLQRHYSGQPIRDIRYRQGDQWLTLEELVRSEVVPETLPWNPQTEAFARIQVDYANGLHVLVNRSDGVLDSGTEVVLPPSGWLVWSDAGTPLAYSAYWPGTNQRVDYLRDDEARIEYLDPRGAGIKGVSGPTLWESGRIVLRADMERNVLVVEDRELPLDAAEAPLTAIDFTFDDGLQGWRPTRGFLSAAAAGGVLHLRTCAEDCYLLAPPLAVPAEQAPWVELRLCVRGDGVRSEGLHFTTAESPNWNADKFVGLACPADGEFHTVRVDVAAHPKWSGTITGLRLDPVSGMPGAEIDIDYVRTP